MQALLHVGKMLASTILNCAEVKHLVHGAVGMKRITGCGLGESKRGLLTWRTRNAHRIPLKEDFAVPGQPVGGRWKMRRFAGFATVERGLGVGVATVLGAGVT